MGQEKATANLPEGVATWFLCCCQGGWGVGAGDAPGLATGSPRTLTWSLGSSGKGHLLTVIRVGAGGWEREPETLSHRHPRFCGRKVEKRCSVAGR